MVASLDPDAPTGARTADEGGAWQVGGAEGGWWAVERAKLLGERLAPLLGDRRLVLDIGCGRGEAVDLLLDTGARYVVGCDFEVYPHWRRHPGRAAYVIGDATRLPFRSGVAGLATAFDVIEHFADDRAPLREARRVIQDDGHVAVTVPALPRLWSPFDDKVGHHRRYTRQTLDVALRSAGLEPEGSTYFFAWLVPPAWALRRRDRAEADAPRTGRAGRALERLLTAVCRAERAVLRRRPLPIGTSLWTLCRLSPGAGT